MTEKSTQALGDGIHQLTIDLPFTSPRSVNCFFIESTDGLTLIDVGVSDDLTVETLVEATVGLAGSVEGLVRIVGTHLHPDHIAAAARLRDRTGAEFVMHRSTADHVPGYNDWTIRGREIAELAMRNGADADGLALLRAEPPRPDWAGTAIPPDRPVDDLDRIPLSEGRYLEVLHTPGHHPTHITLRDSLTGYLFSGDHILPRITPFIPLARDDDGLASYLENLQRVMELDPGVTFPAHGATIEHGQTRAHQIVLHHERRLGEMRDEITEPKTAWTVMGAVFRPGLDATGRYLAFQETMAHLEHLVRIGRARRFLDGETWWYVRR